MSVSRSSKTGLTIRREENKRVVALLREAREKAGLSQVQLAEKLGRNQSYVSKLERGEQGIAGRTYRLLPRGRRRAGRRTERA